MNGAKRNLPSKKIKPIMCVMFDDGYESDYSIAYQEMKARGIVGVSNCPAGLVGNVGRMSWAQVEEMYADGWDFQGHGYSHTPFTSLTSEQLLAEFVASDNAFTAHGIPNPISQGTPATLQNDSVRQAIFNYGYEAISQDNTNNPLNDKRAMNFLIPGWGFKASWTNFDNMNTDIGMATFKRLVDKTIATRNVLIIIAAHKLVDVLTEPFDPMEVTRSRFCEFLDYGIAQGINFMSFTDMYSYVVDYKSKM